MSNMEPQIPKRGAIKRRILRETLTVIPDIEVPVPVLTVLREMVAIITDLIVRELALLKGSEDQFIETEKDMRELHSMLTVAESMGGSDQMLSTLVDDMRQLLVLAEDVVDAFVNEGERQSNWGCFRRTIFFFRDMMPGIDFKIK